MPDSMTQILRAGPAGTKINIAVLGDGFAEADQQAYNDKVQQLLIDGVFGHDYFYEDKQGFNVFRINLVSAESGVSTRVYDEQGTPNDSGDDTIVSTTLRNTALGYIFNGSWAHCWLEGGANTAQLVENALSTWAPDYNLVVIILNNPGFGGCGGGGFQIISMGVGWDVLAHEFGHGLGGLADEYCRNRNYDGAEPGAVNVSANTDRATLKWRRFVNPATPVPTGTGNCAGYNQGASPADWSNSQSVGLFEGGRTYGTGVYRPVIDCRMCGNAPPFCPVCYTHLKEMNYAKTEHNFLNCHAGDFNGDGKDDLLVHTGNSIRLFRSEGSQLDLVFSATERVPGSWQFAAGDQFFIGDFNGDGRQEVAVFNSVNWSMPYLGLLADDGGGGLRLIARHDGAMPGWQFARDDRFHVGDFNGDRRQDLIVFNGSNWSIPYFGMLASTGTSFEFVRRYDGSLPSWQMRKGDKFFLGDFSGEGLCDLFVFNGSDWSIPYLGMLESRGTALDMARRFDGGLPSWEMRPSDRFFVADFDGDGRKDLFVFNGHNWSIPYLGMLRSEGRDLSMARRYDGDVPGWQMRKNDRHFVCDADGDGKEGLFVYNSSDWATEYLGVMRSGGTDLHARWTANWVGEWNLGQVDRFEVSNYEGVPGRRNLIVHNQNWLGMIRAAPNLQLQKIYYRWIHNYRHGRNW